MARRKKILLMLKTPPPYGGGEMMSEWIKESLAGSNKFAILDYSSSNQTRAGQGEFSISKVAEAFCLWGRLVIHLVKCRPKLVFKSFAHGGFPFFRDSVYVLTSKIFCADFACELAGERFHLLDSGRFMKWYAKKILTSVKSIRVLGASIKRRLYENAISNSVVIDNGVLVPEKRKMIKFTRNARVKFLFVGLHSPKKGVDILINALAEVSHTNRNFELHTIGEWCSEDFKAEIIRLVREARIENYVNFHGLKHGSEKWAIYEKCHVFVFPSLTEGQPLAILEALSYGMPIIATKIGGVPDIVTHKKNGFLLSAGSVSELAEGIRYFLDDSDRIIEISNKNVELYESRFTFVRFLEDFQKWLSDCANIRY